MQSYLNAIFYGSLKWLKIIYSEYDLYVSKEPDYFKYKYDKHEWQLTYNS